MNKDGSGSAVLTISRAALSETGIETEDELKAAVERECGLPVWCDELALRGTDGRLAVLEGLRQFREHLGGALCVTLPEGLGAKIEVHEMDEALLERAVALLRERYA